MGMDTASSSTVRLRSKSILKFFLLVFTLSLPFWLLGRVIEHQLLPGVPVRGFICTDMPGWISAHYTFTAPANQSRYEMESGSRGCGISVGAPAEFDIIRAAAIWKLLQPGESLDFQDTFSKVIPGSIKRGRYSFRCGPDLTDDEQRKLTAAGIYTTLGRYESNEVVMNIVPRPSATLDRC